VTSLHHQAIDRVGSGLRATAYAADDGGIEGVEDPERDVVGVAWHPEMQQSGLRRGASYLVRPDGYVALTDAHADAERLRQYFAEREDVGRPANRAGPGAAPDRAG